MQDRNEMSEQIFEMMEKGKFSNKDVQVLFQLAPQTLSKWRKGGSHPKQIYLDVLQLLLDRPELSVYFGIRQAKKWEPIPEELEQHA